MFDDLIMTTYGRGKIDRNWYISSSFGSNRIYYIHSGDVFYMGTGSVEKLNVGHLYFFPQNLKFELEFDKNKPIDHTYFDFITTPPIKIDNFINIGLEKNETINAASKILFTLGEKYPRWFDKNYEKLIISYTQNLLTLIDKVHPIGTVFDDRINRIVKFIHENIDKQITIEQLAGLCCVEKNYFIRIFKANMFVPPYQYIKNYRLKLATTYLEKNYSVSETADMVGYSDTASFSHAFKKEYGIYPSEYGKNFV